MRKRECEGGRQIGRKRSISTMYFMQLLESKQNEIEQFQLQLQLSSVEGDRVNIVILSVAYVPFAIHHRCR